MRDDRTIPAIPPLYSALLFALVTTLALILLQSGGTPDVHYWIGWIKGVGEDGVISTFAGTAEMYPPLAYVYLYFVSMISTGLGIAPFIALKVTILLFLLLTSAAFYAFSRDAMLTILLQLALTIDSVSQSYLDVYYTPLLIGAFIALRKRDLFWFSVLFCVSFLIKWQPVILLPFLLVYVFEIDSLSDIKKIDRGALVKVLGPMVVILLAMLLIFGVAFPESLFNASKEGWLSGYALNLNWIITYILHVSDPASYGPLTEYGFIKNIRTTSLPVLLLGGLKLLAFAVYTFVFICFIKAPKTLTTLLKYSTLGFLSYFIFYTGVHENHLYVPVILTALLASTEARERGWFLLMALALNINLFIFYGTTGGSVHFKRSLGTFDLSLPLAVLFVLIYLILAYKTIVLDRAEARRSGVVE